VREPQIGGGQKLAPAKIEFAPARKYGALPSNAHQMHPTGQATGNLYIQKITYTYQVNGVETKIIQKRTTNICQT
jgi:hypothetical protein